MNAELGNMQLLRKQNKCRKFYKEINMAKKEIQGTGGNTRWMGKTLCQIINWQ